MGPADGEAAGSPLGVLGRPWFELAPAWLVRRWRRPEVRFPVRFLLFALIGLVAYESVDELGRFATAVALELAETGARLAGLEPRVLGDGVVSFGGGAFSYNVTRACSALQVTFLYAAAVVAFPSSWRDRGVGLALGVPLVLGLNGARLVTMAWLGVNAPGMFAQAHFVWWQALFVAVVALGWFAWVRLVARRDGPAAGTWVRILSAASLFTGTVILLWLAGTSAGGVPRYRRLVTGLVSGLAALAPGPGGPPVPSPVGDGFGYAYGVLAATVALYLATPGVPWGERFRAAGTLGGLSVLGLDVALLSVATVRRSGWVAPWVYDSVVGGIVHVVVPLAVWFAWARRQGIIGGEGSGSGEGERAES